MFTISNSWEQILEKELEKDYMKDIQSFLDDERKKGKVIYPKQEEIFAALNSTSFENIKVVILGQDPYHGEGQAHGLSFSVQEGMKIPPSLRNIYKEIDSDIGYPQGVPLHGNLEHWAKQGVLLLNSSLTVEAGSPASHGKIGWQNFTDAIIQIISDQKSNIVFLFWGAYAQSKKEFIDCSRHLILETTHPSPFSAYRGFLGSKHFSQTNSYLKTKNKLPIKW